MYPDQADQQSVYDELLVRILVSLFHSNMKPHCTVHQYVQLEEREDGCRKKMFVSLIVVCYNFKNKGYLNSQMGSINHVVIFTFQRHYGTAKYKGSQRYQIVHSADLCLLSFCFSLHVSKMVHHTS